MVDYETGNSPKKKNKEKNLDTQTLFPWSTFNLVPSAEEGMVHTLWRL